MLAKQEPKYMVNEDGRICNRVTGDPIPDDEPIFIFRAKDEKSINALTAYLAACFDPEHRVAVTKRLEDFVRYQATHPALVGEPNTTMWPVEEG